MPIVVDVGGLDLVGLQVERRKAEPGPVLAVFSYRARAVPGDGGRAAWRLGGVGQGRDAAVAQAPRVAGSARCLVGDRPGLVSPPPPCEAVRVQSRRALGREV